MLIFGSREPTAEQAAEGYEADPERYDRTTPCLTYMWIGQDFSTCDGCSKPCWEHPYEPGMGNNAGLRRRITEEKARAIWKRWGEPKGIEFRPPPRVPSDCLAVRNA